LEEMKAMIEDRQEETWCEGSADELFEGYKKWINYESEDSSEEDSDDHCSLCGWDEDELEPCAHPGCQNRVCNDCRVIRAGSSIGQRFCIGDH